MTIPGDQALTYVLNGPDLEVAINFDEFTVAGAMGGA
jgi:hypothetical protein